MAIRKHPVIFGICLVSLLGLVSILLLHGISALSGGSSFSSHGKVGIVDVRGIIASSQEVVEQLDTFRKDDNIQAVVVRIDSPGGGVAASQEIYSAIKELKKRKKVVASFGSVAASGGYLIACAADRIVANPGTITGSVSVIMYFTDAEDLLKKIGVRASVIKSGKYKDIGSPTREMRADEKEVLQVLVDDIYDQFIDLVAADRKMPEDDVKEIADGRVFTGRQAQTLKLVDDLGDKAAAIQLAGKMAGLKGLPETVYARKKDITFWDFILQQSAVSLADIVKEKLPALPRGVNLIYEYGL